ncbi:UNVERIFIED_CONTAM: hypothetical protein K2H54_031203 [Gekko kuhli]
MYTFLQMVLELDRIESSMDAEQLEKEKQQNEGRSTSMNDKIYEKKRRDSKTSSTLTKSIPMSVSGNPSGSSTSKEVKKSKLVRSQSFSSQALHSKYGSIDKCSSKSSSSGYSSVPGVGKSSLFSFTDDTFRTRSSNSSGTAAFSSTSTLPSSSRSSSNSLDQKNNGSKESHSRKKKELAQNLAQGVPTFAITFQEGLELQLDDPAGMVPLLGQQKRNIHIGNAKEIP